MDKWSAVFLALDLALMGLLLYFVKKNKDDLSGNSELLSEKIIAATNALSELSRSREEMKALEKRLLEREKAVVSIIRQAKISAANEAPVNDDFFNKNTADPYRKATELLKSGHMNNDINGLGLLKGELELISALNNCNQRQ